MVVGMWWHVGWWVGGGHGELGGGCMVGMVGGMVGIVVEGGGWVVGIVSQMVGGWWG